MGTKLIPVCAECGDMMELGKCPSCGSKIKLRVVDKSSICRECVHNMADHCVLYSGLSVIELGSMKECDTFTWPNDN